jgi:uncharacterized membrane protein YdbT with pleckstrin-like domain
MTFLIEGEKIIKRFGQSRIVHTKHYVAAIALFLVPFLYPMYLGFLRLPVSDIQIAAVAVGTGILLVAVAELRRAFGSYYITNYRVVSVRGLLKKTMDSCTYDKIVNVKTVQSLFQRMFGMGTIDITTYQKTEILLNSIGNPTGIEKMIYSAMEGQQAHRQEQGAGQARQPAAEKAPEEPARQPVAQPAGGEAQWQGRRLVAADDAATAQAAGAQQAAGQVPVQAQPQKKKRFGIF